MTVTDSTAEDALNGYSEETPTEETTEPTGGKTFFIPPEYQDDAIKNAQPGDVIKIKIVGKDADGAVEAQCDNEVAEGEGEEEDWKSSLANAMPEEMGGKMKGKLYA